MKKRNILVCLLFLLLFACKKEDDDNIFSLTSEEKQFIPYQIGDEVTLICNDKDTVTLSVISSDIDTLFSFSIGFSSYYETKTVILVGGEYRIAMTVDKDDNTFNFETYFSKEFSGGDEYIGNSYKFRANGSYHQNSEFKFYPGYENIVSYPETLNLEGKRFSDVFSISTYNQTEGQLFFNSKDGLIYLDCSELYNKEYRFIE